MATSSTAETTNNNEPLRVILWSVPRSLSTVFEKCMSYVPHTLIINEAFVCAYHLGPDGHNVTSMVSKDLKVVQEKKLEQVQLDLPMAFDGEKCSYDFVKGEMEADYPGKSLIFCKDMAYGLDGKHDKLPASGYRHTFLIRNPHRQFVSYKKMLGGPILMMTGKREFRLPDLPVALMPKGFAVKELHDLITYFQEAGIEPDPIIIDADDLLENPGSILRQYCNLTGIPYSEELLQWPSAKDGMKSWKGAREFLLGNLVPDTGGYYDAALNSTCFHPPKEMPRREDLDEDVLECVDFSMPYYDKMYAMRLKP